MYQLVAEMVKWKLRPWMFMGAMFIGSLLLLIMWSGSCPEQEEDGDFPYRSVLNRVTLVLGGKFGKPPLKTLVTQIVTQFV